MSDVFTLSTNYYQSEEETAKSHGAVFYPDPSTYKNPITEVVNSLGLGVASGAEKLYRASTQNPFSDKIRDPRTFQFDRRDVGSIGQFVGQMAEGLTVFGAGTAATGGNPLAGYMALWASEGYEATQKHMRDGVDQNTASILGATEGFWHMLGFSVPRFFKGFNLPANMISGGVQTTLSGVAGRASTSAILSKAGYEEQSNMHRPFEAKALWADFILGMAFGGAGHIMHGKNPKTPHGNKTETSHETTVDVDNPFDVTPDHIDMAVAIKRDQSAVKNLGDGIPVTPEALYTKERVKEEAYHSLILGEEPKMKPEDAKTIYENSIPQEEPPLHPYIEENKIKEYPEVEENPEPLFHDIDTPRTELDEFVPEGDVALARFEKTYPEEAKAIREEITKEIEEIKEWKTLLKEAVECHFS